MAGIGYRPEIDGLRAFAVVPVILFHMGLSWLPGGYIGVDVFFVISGFLITSIIKKELDQGTFSFRDFWARRVRRILPAMIFVTACTLAVTYIFGFRPEQQPIGGQALAALLSVANIYFWLTTGDYWGNAAEESPFLHTWSLSVEEQFYLFFPIAMWLIFRFRSRWLQGCIATATVGSLALFLWGTQHYPTTTFYLLPTRVWELGTGCLLAVSLGKQSPKNSNFGIFAMAGFGMVFLSYLFFDTLNAGLALAVFGTALIIAFGQTGLCNKLLSQRPVVHIGKISYSLYLWHWPVLVAANSLGFDWPGPLDKAFLACAIYVLAVGTYLLVEKPIRRRPKVVPRILATALLLAFLAVSMAFLPRHYDVSNFEQALCIDYDCSPNLVSANRAAKGIGTQGVSHGVAYEHRGYYPNAHSRNGITVVDNENPFRILVFGDSHGLMWGKPIADVAQDLSIPTRFFTIGGGESPFFNIPPTREGSTAVLSAEEKYQFDFARLRAIQEWNPSLVLIAARWQSRDLEKSGPLLSLLQSLEIPTLLIETPPSLKIGNRNAMQYLAWKRLLPALDSPIQKTILPCSDPNRHVREIASRYSNVEIIQTYDLFAADEGAIVLEGKTPLYLDDDHVTTQGAMRLTPRLRHIISQHLPSL